MLSNSDMFLIVLFSIIIIIYEMLTQGVLTIEMLQGVFSGNAIIYIIFAVVIIFLRKYLSPAPAKSQIAKLEKTVLMINNELSDHEWAGIWCSISNKFSGNGIFTCRLETLRSIVPAITQKKLSNQFQAEWNIVKIIRNGKGESEILHCLCFYLGC